MTSPVQAANAFEEWNTLLAEYEDVLTQLAPLQGMYDGGLNSAAEHVRKSLRASIAEELRKHGMTEKEIENKSRIDPRYVRSLRRTVEEKTEMARLAARRVILEQKIGMARAIVYSVSKFGGVQP